VADDVNIRMPDQLAEQTQAASSHVRPAEDIGAKVSRLYSKISNPVLINLRPTAGDNVRLEEVYPPVLPDLFHGGQLMVQGRYNGQGPTAVNLAGQVGRELGSVWLDEGFDPRMPAVVVKARSDAYPTSCCGSRR
jgi:Ca-activated chloride channel family protein